MDPEFPPDGSHPVPSTKASSCVNDQAGSSFCSIRQIVYVSIIGVYSLVFLVTTVLFYLRGKYIRDIKLRSIRLTLLQAAMGYVLTMGILLASQDRRQVPCYVYLWGLHIGYYLWNTMLICRTLQFIVKARMSEDRMLWVVNLAQGERLCDCASQPRGRPALGPLLRKLVTPIRPLRQTTTPTPTPAGRLPGRNGPSDPALAPSDLFLCRHRCRALNRLLKYVFLGGLVLLLAYCLTIQLSNARFRASPPVISCHGTFSYYTPLLGMLALDMLVVYPVAAYLLWYVADAYRIRSELVKSILFSTVCLLVCLIHRAPNFGVNRFVKPLDFLALGVMGTHMLSVVVPLFQTRRFGSIPVDEHDEKKTPNYVGFQRVLSDRILFQKLKESAGKCFCPETIIFLEDYQRLKNMVYYSYLSWQHPSHYSWLSLTQGGSRLIESAAHGLAESAGGSEGPKGAGPTEAADKPLFAPSPEDPACFQDDLSLNDGPSERLRACLELQSPSLSTPGGMVPSSTGVPSFIEFPTPITYTIFATIDEVRTNTVPLNHAAHQHAMLGRFQPEPDQLDSALGLDRPLPPSASVIINTELSQMGSTGRPGMSKVPSTMTMTTPTIHPCRTHQGTPLGSTTGSDAGSSALPPPPDWESTLDLESPWAPGAMNDSVVIELHRVYKKFFAAHSEFTLPIEYHTLREIQSRAEEGHWKLDMFDGARIEILHLVYANVFPKFLAHFAEILEHTRK